MRPWKTDRAGAESKSSGSMLSVMRPVPLALLGYALLLWIVQIYVGSLPTPEGGAREFDRVLFGSVRISHVLLVVHAAWLNLMLIECRRAVSSPPGYRKGHLAGAVLGVALAIALCVWAVRLGGLV